MYSPIPDIPFIFRRGDHIPCLLRYLCVEFLRIAVVSIRLNKEEEKILAYLTEHLHEDKSAIFKKSIYELYEDVQDIRFIEN